MGADERTHKAPFADSDHLPAEGVGCGDWAGELALFLDGELGEAERTEMETHLDSCAKCQASVDFALAFRTMLRDRTKEAGIAPAALRSRIRSTIAAEAAPTAGWSSPLQQIRRLWSPMPAAAAGATAIGLTAWLWFGGSTDDIVKELVARHARHLPPEIQSSDPRSLEAWFADKVDFHVNVPQAHGVPFNLVGARLSYVRDHSAVQLFYGTPQSPSRRVTMLVFDDPSGKMALHGIPRKINDVDVYTANRAGYNVSVWRENEVVYSLVSDGDEDVVDALVRGAR